MARRSRGSRSERKAERERAAHAREHGLPAAAPPARTAARFAVGSEESDATSLDSTSPRALAKRSAGTPALVWVVGGGLAILVAVYVLSRLRAP